MLVSWDQNKYSIMTLTSKNSSFFLTSPFSLIKFLWNASPTNASLAHNSWSSCISVCRCRRHRRIFTCKNKAYNSKWDISVIQYFNVTLFSSLYQIYVCFICILPICMRNQTNIKASEYGILLWNICLCTKNFSSLSTKRETFFLFL